MLDIQSQKIVGQKMKKRFSNEQSVASLRQAAGGIPVLDVNRKLGMTEQTFYRWKKNSAGPGIADRPSGGDELENEVGLCLAHRFSLEPRAFPSNILKAHPSSHGDSEGTTVKGVQYARS